MIITSVFSGIFISTIALRIIFLYPVLPISFIVCLLVDLFIGLFPLAILVLVSIINEQRNEIIKKRNLERQKNLVKGLEPQYC